MAQWQAFTQNMACCSHRPYNRDQTFGIKRLSTESYLVDEFINGIRTIIRPKEEIIKIVIYGRAPLDNFQNDYFVCLPGERQEHEAKIRENYLPTRKVAIGFSRPFRTLAFESYVDLATQIASQANFKTDYSGHQFYFLVEEKLYLGEIQYLLRQNNANPNCPCCVLRGSAGPRGVTGLNGDYPEEVVFRIKPFLESLLKLDKLT